MIARQSISMAADPYPDAPLLRLKFSVSQLANASAEIAAASVPHLRLFTVGSMASPSPLDEIVNVLHSWRAATPENVLCNPSARLPARHR